jgi:7,8-dihydroneopterin aldolase/epimerase/oxygenase
VGWSRAGRSETRPAAGACTSIEIMTDTVSIRGLRVSAVIGVYAWERETEQVLTFGVDMAVDVTRAAATDDVADAVDYSKVAATVTSVVRDGQFQLIETAVERVAERVLADFPVGWARVEVAKPIAADGGTRAYTAVISIERARALGNYFLKSKDNS